MLWYRCICTLHLCNFFLFNFIDINTIICVAGRFVFVTHYVVRAHIIILLLFVHSLILRSDINIISMTRCNFTIICWYDLLRCIIGFDFIVRLTNSWIRISCRIIFMCVITRIIKSMRCISFNRSYLCIGVYFVYLRLRLLI